MTDARATRTNLKLSNGGPGAATPVRGRIKSVALAMMPASLAETQHCLAVTVTAPCGRSSPNGWDVLGGGVAAP